MNQFKDFKSVVNTLVSNGPMPLTNVIIGGSNALMLHGLVLPNKPKELDIIVYEPTPVQKTYLQTIESFALPNDHEGSSRRSHKFAICLTPTVTTYLDVIIEKEPLPAGLLYHFVKELDLYLPVQSIENVMAARRSYAFERNSDGMNLYVRKKDVIDTIALKNLNFNL